MRLELMRGPKNLYDFLDKAWRHLEGGVSDSRSSERYTAVAKVEQMEHREARTVALLDAAQSKFCLRATPI